MWLTLILPGAGWELLVCSKLSSIGARDREGLLRHCLL